MFRSNIQVIITFIIAAGAGFFVKTSANCESSYNVCDNGFNFGYPFYGGIFDSSGNCGYPGFQISCNSERGRPVMNVSDRLLYVMSIDNDAKSLRLMGVIVDDEVCPRPTQNFSVKTTSALWYPNDTNRNIIYFYNCSGYPENVEQHLPCLDPNNNTTERSFTFLAEEIPEDGFNWYRNCESSVLIPVVVPNYAINSLDYRPKIKFGFDLFWSTPVECMACERSGGRCLFTENGAPPLCSCENDTRRFQGNCPEGRQVEQNVIIGVSVGIGGLLLSILLTVLFMYRRICSSLCRSNVSHWKYKSKTPTNVEAFLENGGSFGMQRYRYSEIKKMTDSFKEKLGQGGFGSVFKGKLPDGHLVAIKLLNELKGNGEDFINEVATIGNTNHVNVVRLLGFCSSGTQRALVYEFMPNGSLEKFTYDEENSSINPHLCLEKFYQIALGIAKGLEYLHCGCNTRILHLDIKPHNILLDQDFCPKISDFGLAKLCQTRESIVSMHVARGTIGYIAPEVYFRNFGGVSHKSDVYSYGMMILEMIGTRKNLDATLESTSEIYFPQYIYDHFNHDTKIEGLRGMYKEETTKKMIIVALWCINTHSANRPSISKVVEMLEGNVDELQMPQNPFQEPPSRLSSSLM